MALPPLITPIRNIGWRDWDPDDLVVLECPAGAHEGRTQQGLGTIRQLGYDEIYTETSFRGGARWLVVVPNCLVQHLRGYPMAPPELQGARPPD
jgi:hypothetical protein